MLLNAIYQDDDEYWNISRLNLQAHTHAHTHFSRITISIYCSYTKTVDWQFYMFCSRNDELLYVVYKYIDIFNRNWTIRFRIQHGPYTKYIFIQNACAIHYYYWVVLLLIFYVIRLNSISWKIEMRNSAIGKFNATNKKFEPPHSAFMQNKKRTKTNWQYFFQVAGLLRVFFLLSVCLFGLFIVLWILCKVYVATGHKTKTESYFFSMVSILAWRIYRN